jgi:asparagine synthase (glutamine-hydrolysing)
MCGICGVVASDGRVPLSRESLTGMRDSMSHRGPDDTGLLVEAGVALGSRRLAIVDLSARGHMPMESDDGRYAIVHNGEVYNFREIRSAIGGEPFRSDTDTEVILRAFARWGAGCLDRFNGMFAFAIWDRHERELFIARDRLGVKPLYVAAHDDRFWFASEQKALFAGGVPFAFDESTLPELLTFRYVAGETTPFSGVRRLLPGHYGRWKDGEFRTHRWWSLASVIRGESAFDAAFTPSATAGAEPEWFRRTFDAAIDLRRISDVPLGVLLSGGLDSGSVAASLSRNGEHGLASFTVRFSEAGFDEGELSRLVAERWSLHPTEASVSTGDLLPLLREASEFNDEPLAQGSDAHLLAISRIARPAVTVLLSGEGADESLGGYVRYQPLRWPGALRSLSHIHGALMMVPGSRAKKLARLLSLGGLRSLVLYNACNSFPDDLRTILDAPPVTSDYRESILDEAEAIFPGEPFRQAMHLDQHTFLSSLLDRNDRMTMGASIECRVPFLDVRLIEGLARMRTTNLVRGSRSKPLLRRALGDRLPLPVLRGRKWGFGVPWSRYLRDVADLRDVVSGIPSSSLLDQGPFKREGIRRLIDEFLGGSDERFPLVLQLVMLEVWWHSYAARFRGSPESLVLQT